MKWIGQSMYEHYNEMLRRKLARKIIPFCGRLSSIELGVYGYSLSPWLKFNFTGNDSRHILYNNLVIGHCFHPQLWQVLSSDTHSVVNQSCCVLVNILHWRWEKRASKEWVTWPDIDTVYQHKFLSYVFSSTTVVTSIWKREHCLNLTTGLSLKPISKKNNFMSPLWTTVSGECWVASEETS